MSTHTSSLEGYLQYRLLVAAGRLTRVLNNRGIHRAARALSLVFPHANTAIVDIKGGARVEINLSDSYWAPLACGPEYYEKEVTELVIQILSSNQSAYFLDLGANLGYFSALAAAISPNRVVAVEASPPMHDLLVRNAELNAGKFRTIPPSAIWRSDGERLEIVTHEIRHAGASVVNRSEKVGTPGYSAHKVPTVTIDALLSGVPRCPILVKLDVEGAESQALEGAIKSIDSRDIVFIYEDHGQDPTSSISREFLNRGFQIAAPMRDGMAIPMHSPEQVTSIKKRTSVGYNFIAYRNGSDLIESIRFRE